MQFLNEMTEQLQDEYAAQGVECNKDTVCQQTVSQLNDRRVGVRWSAVKMQLLLKDFTETWYFRGGGQGSGGSAAPMWWQR
jgi:hypothetical protein